jgi:hypothetical protein
MNAISTDATELPRAITIYQAAHDRRDVPTALTQFTIDARIIDDGRTHEGISGVESFLRMAGSEYTYTRTLVAVEEIAPDRWHVTNHLEGNFPGGHVDLSYEFHLVGSLIASLIIAP